MSWITNDWRLKFLALGLAVLMLGAVAFSQNPQTNKVFSVPLIYHLPPNPTIIITNGPAKVNVTVAGLADAVNQLTSDNVSAFADAAHATPGQAVKLNVTASATIPTVSAQTAPQIVVNIDQLKTVEIPVTVNAKAAPGYTVNTANTYAKCAPNPTPCKVHFSGPASWENGITASVDYTSPVNFSVQESSSWPVRLRNGNGQLINLSLATYPALSLDFYNVTVHVEGQYGATIKTVAIVAASPSQPPPPQFHIVGVTINPATVNISGDPATLGSIQFITLPAIDLSGARGNTTVHVTVPYPDNVSGNVTTVGVTYLIQPNPSPSPSP
ncbi:MAG TPA: CdaR family protein [Candidatus Dormibacteraeota bacterium]|nr:CdaR family protein [Candidatus Dormibacteraeota bacterium]